MSRKISIKQARELVLEVLDRNEKERIKFAESEAKQTEELTIFELVNKLNLYLHNNGEIPVEKLYLENELVHILFNKVETMFKDSGYKVFVDTETVSKYSYSYAIITRFYAKKI
jgi:hypothetical protein